MGGKRVVEKERILKSTIFVTNSVVVTGDILFAVAEPIR